MNIFKYAENAADSTSCKYYVKVSSSPLFICTLYPWDDFLFYLFQVMQLNGVEIDTFH